MTAVPPRTLNMATWSLTSPPRDRIDSPAVEPNPGRYHRVGDPRTWYGSSSVGAAWAELRRHWLDENVEVGQTRLEPIQVVTHDLQVLDLTDPKIQDLLDVDPADLIAEDVTACQHLARRARAGGAEGILAPSAAVPSRQTLAVFRAGLSKLTVERS